MALGQQHLAPGAAVLYEPLHGLGQAAAGTEFFLLRQGEPLQVFARGRVDNGEVKGAGLGRQEQQFGTVVAQAELDGVHPGAYGADELHRVQVR